MTRTTSAEPRWTVLSVVHSLSGERRSGPSVPLPRRGRRTARGLRRDRCGNNYCTVRGVGWEAMTSFDRSAGSTGAPVQVIGFGALGKAHPCNFTDGVPTIVFGSAGGSIREIFCGKVVGRGGPPKANSVRKTAPTSQPSEPIHLVTGL